MDAGKKREYELLELIRTGKPMTWSERLDLIVRLSIPSILAQLSVIVMLYIDASMVGSLGANASASIGLVSTTTWLFSGVCTAAATGFSVQVAHLIGANDPTGARNVLRQAFSATLLFGLFASAVGCAVSGSLPGWLGGNDAIAPDASRYFLIYALSLPFLQVNYLSGSMLRCSGNMRVPSMLSVLMCVLDVIFNTLLIFPTRTVYWGGAEVVFPGAGMGVAGAALGTALAVIATAGLMTCYLWFRSPELALGKERGSFRPTAECLRKAVRIGLPIGCEHVILCGAQILTTVIVAPLGTAAIAANAFAITAESLCYMPGYGIADAATTLVGQSKGAGRRMLTQRFARMTVSLGMVVMAFMGLVMYVAAPLMMGIMTPDPEIRGARHHGTAHRGFRRADVRRFDRSLRGFHRCRGHRSPELHEFLQHLGRTAHAGRAARPDDGIAGCMDRHVHRTLFPRRDFPRPAAAGQMAGCRHPGLLNPESYSERPDTGQLPLPGNGASGIFFVNSE